ncbi:MAG: helix-turn-helix domain-containing protein [Patescibacteria group bacterium]
MIENLLETCGLNQTEQKVFLHLLRRGKCLASVLAKQLDIKRPTAYAALENLVKLGIVNKQKLNQVNYFSTVSVQLIPKIFEEKAKNDFENKHSATKLLGSHLSQLQNTNLLAEKHFEMVSFESIEAVYAQMKDALLGGDFCSIFNPQKTIFGNLKNIVSEFLKETAKTKVNIREIAVSGPMTDWYIKQVNNPNHSLRQVPESSGIMTDFILLRGSIYLLDYDPKNEVAVKITHDAHFKSMQAMFDMVWQSIK